MLSMLRKVHFVTGDRFFWLMLGRLGIGPRGERWSNRLGYVTRTVGGWEWLGMWLWWRKS